MDAIEKAVRNALEKGDAEDKNFRRRVYVSARHALEKSMKGKKMTQSVADEKFARLAEVAGNIESEFSEAEEIEDFQPLGRRSYEAAAPLVEDTPPLDETLAEQGVEASPVPEQAFARASEIEGHAGGRIVRSARACWNRRCPRMWTELARKPAKPAKKPGARKKTSRKAAILDTRSEADPAAEGADLFEKSVPVWKDVSLPATYEAEAAEDTYRCLT